MWDSFSDAAASPENGENIDWVTLYYIGTVVLHMPESTFWRCTLRKVQALFSCHCAMHTKSAPQRA